MMGLGKDAGTSSISRFGTIENSVHLAESRHDLFSDRSFREKLFSRLDELLPRRGVLSLDVFDTLVLRDQSSELTRFYEVGARMASLVNARAPARLIRQVDAFLARHLGTGASYRAGRAVDGCREGSLTEIHRTASRLLGQGDDMKESFIQAELDYEAERLSVNHALLRYAQQYRELGGRVALVSDMYMHADQLRGLLGKLSIEDSAYDCLVSSADTKVSKASGRIFPLLERVMRLEPGDFLHVGDSLLGDFRRPIQRGWRALHVPVAEAELQARRRDHAATASMLATRYRIVVDIAMPR
jgi:FMN phosphatase YigB (HAD superfamily)